MSSKGKIIFIAASFIFVLLFGESTSQSNVARPLKRSIPDSFDNHGLQRIDQRSPSLRLRYGRSLFEQLPINALEKRWFGDVNKKPIRSPSLRLRFGRRSDPAVPLRSVFDERPLNNLEDTENGDDLTTDTFKRILRKAQRLRWGRSMPPYVYDNEENNNLMDVEDDSPDSVDYLNDLLNAEKLRNMLQTLRNIEELRSDDDDDDDVANEFQREIRKPGPLRLRFGRSTKERDAGVAFGKHVKISSLTNALETTEIPKNTI